MRSHDTSSTSRISLTAMTLTAVLAVTTVLAACGSEVPTSSTSPTSSAGALVQPGTTHLGGGETLRTAAPVIHVAEELYTFWDTGNATYLDDAVSPTFHDNTLPAGRPQGREGILAASRTFRIAVPDLHCQVANLYITSSTFTAQLVFSGHFTGTLDGRRGTGQPVRFNAIDIQHVGPAHQITEDWHIEDNLTFLGQAGVINVP